MEYDWSMGYGGSLDLVEPELGVGDVVYGGVFVRLVCWTGVLGEYRL